MVSARVVVVVWLRNQSIAIEGIGYYYRFYRAVVISCAVLNLKNCRIEKFDYNSRTWYNLEIEVEDKFNLKTVYSACEV